MTARKSGSIKNIGTNKWEVKISIIDEHGYRRRPQQTVHGNKTQAKQALQALQEKYALGASGAMTFKQFCEDYYLPYHYKIYPRRSSINKIKYTTYKLIEEFSNVSMAQFSISEMTKWSETAPAWKINKLKAIFSYAVKIDVINKNPLQAVLIHHNQPQKKRFSEDDLKIILQLVENTAIEPIVWLMACTGIRKTEALAINWEDIDFATGKIMINKTYHYERGEGYIEDAVKNSASCAPVYVPQKCLEHLQKLQTANGTKTGALCHAPRNQHERISPDGLLHQWRNIILPNLQERYLPIENLRHTHGSILFDNGVNIDTISKRLRHSNNSITQQYYLQSSGIMERNAGHVFDEILQ